MNEVALAAALTVSVAGVSYAAFAPRELPGTAQAIADEATCRAVDTAIVGYITLHDHEPRSIADLKPYVKGDISNYRIVGGMAAGPGC